MYFWQFKVPMKHWAEDGTGEFENLIEDYIYFQNIENKSNEPRNNIDDIVFIHNNKEISKEYPKGIYLICKIQSSINNDSISLKVIKNLKDKPFNYDNSFIELHEYYNTTKIRKRVQSKELLDNKFNPQKLYDLITSDEINNILPEELNQEDSKNLIEGAKKEITVNFYERSSKARQECINEYGVQCSVCDFDFEKVYGEIGKDFIHVHHLTEISSIAENYEINPIEDLRPVCPNCHAMLHKNKPKPYTISELKEIIEKQMFKAIEIKYINEDFGSANNAMAHIGTKNGLKEKYQKLILNENNIDNIIKLMKNNYNNELYFDFEIYLNINNKEYIIDSKFNLQ
jgi:predicted HNH restriction endonuclease